MFLVDGRADVRTHPAPDARHRATNGTFEFDDVLLVVDQTPTGAVRPPALERSAVASFRQQLPGPFHRPLQKPFVLFVRIQYLRTKIIYKIQ